MIMNSLLQLLVVLWYVFTLHKCCK